MDELLHFGICADVITYPCLPVPTQRVRYSGGCFTNVSWALQKFSRNFCSMFLVVLTIEVITNAWECSVTPENIPFPERLLNHFSGNRHSTSGLRHVVVAMLSVTRLLGRAQEIPMMTSSNGSIFRVTGPCEGNPSVTGGFHSQRPVTLSFDSFNDPRPNKW